MADEQEVRELATAIQNTNQNPSDFEGIRKGVVQSIQTSNPPTITITLSGDNTQIAGVKYTRSYFPVVGDTVLMHKQGNELIAFDAVTTTYKNDYTRTSSDAGAGITWSGNQFSVKNGTGLVFAGDLSLTLDSAIAGNGLSYSSGAININTGVGLNIASDVLRVNQAAGARTVGIDYGGVTDTGNFQTCDHPTAISTALGVIDDNFYITALCINDIINKLKSAGLMS